MMTLQEIMGNYFEEEIKKPLQESTIRLTVNTPIAPRKFDWERMSDPERLGKTFDFKTHHEYKSFLGELMSYEANIGHHAKIICEFPKIHIEVYTHKVNGITEMDLEYTAEMDDIRRDVAYYVEEDE